MDTKWSRSHTFRRRTSSSRRQPKFSGFCQAPPPTPQKRPFLANAPSEMAIFPSSKVKIDRRLDRNGHFGLRRRPKTTNAPSEMAISPSREGQNRGAPRAKWPFSPPARGECEGRFERNGHFAAQEAQNRGTPRAKWPFCPPEGAKTRDATSEMAIFYLQGGRKRETPRAKWPFSTSRRGQE